MSFVRASRIGFRRGIASPRLVLALWLVCFAAALPAAWVMASSISDSVGESRVHENLRSGFDMYWYGEFNAEARGIETTLTPAVTGIGAFLRNLEGLLTGKLFSGFPGLIGLGLIYAILWAFLLGGVLEHFVRPAGTASTSGFVQSGGRYFGRFVRLALVSGVLYFLVYRLHRVVFRWLDDLTRDVTSEKTVLLYSLAGFALTAVLLGMIHLVFSYAKIATVVEDRRSMIFAALRGLRFVLANPFRTIGLVLAVVVIGTVLLALYAWVGPGAAEDTWPGVVLAFLAGQLMLIARLVLRLSLLGAETALFQQVEGGGLS